MPLSLKIACLCPTFDRPKQLANAIACFEAQDYPQELRRLLILDDGHSVVPERSERGWEIVAAPERFASLPEKYQALSLRAAAMTVGTECYADTFDDTGEPIDSWIQKVEEPFDPEAYAIWEDDDVYLPWHLSAHAEVLAKHPWSKPSRIWSTYPSPAEPVLESATGRFFASIAFRRDLFEQVGGFVITDRADFDQQFMRRLHDAAPPGDPAALYRPSYVFRWDDTGAPHGQGQMRSPSDDRWYDRYGELAAASERGPVPLMMPQFDAATIKIKARIEWDPAAFRP